MKKLLQCKSPIIRDLIEEIDSGIMPDSVYRKVMQCLNTSIIRECESIDLHDPSLLQVRIFHVDYIIYQRSDTKLEMIEKKNYEILKCKQII